MATGDSFPGSTGVDYGTNTSETGGSSRMQAVKDKAADLKSKAADLGRNAASSIDRNMSTAADALERSAQKLRSRSETGWTSTAAVKMESTARYLRTHHTDAVIGDLDRVVRRNPSAAMAACFGIGFLIGMALRRDDD